MKNNSEKEIWNRIKNSKKILMQLHSKPDGDSLGSCCAMKYILEKEGLEIRLISKDELAGNISDYDFSKEVEYGVGLDDVSFEEFDTIIFLDQGTIELNSDEILDKLEKNKEKIINIDHHEVNNFYGEYNYVIKESASCCSVLFDFFKTLGIKFDKNLSRRLLLGICTDTNFGEWGDSGDTFEKMGILIKEGKIDYQNEFYLNIKSNSWELKKFWGILLSNMCKIEIDKKNIGYSWAKKEEYEKMGLNEADLRLGVLCMQDIKDLDLIFTLTERRDNIKGSFRSKGLDTNLYSIEFGGGGHKEASAFFLEKMEMDKAIKKVLEIIRKKGFLSIE